MLEQVLNLAWLAVAASSITLLIRRRSDRRALIALLFALALLFPLISATDDMMNVDRATDGQAFAVLGAAIVLAGLMIVSRLFSREHAPISFVLVPHCDPRSPPRR